MRPPHRRRYRSLSTAPLALAALLSAVACGDPPAEPPEAIDEPRAGGTAVVAVPAGITGINPLLDSSEEFSESLLDMLYLKLFEERPDFADGPPGFDPELAAAWEWSEDGRTLTVELAPDISWDDGVPVTADDVVWTWRLQTDERLGWRYAGLKQSIESIAAIDERRLRVRFADDSLGRLASLNQGQILPRHRWRELPVDEWIGNGGWFLDNQVVNGPFRVAEWRPAEQIVLERNPAYHRPGHPLLDRVMFRVVPDATSRLNRLLAGEVDFVPRVLPGALARVEAAQAVRLEAFHTHGYSHIQWNLRRPMLADVAARQALILAIDRRRLIETLWFGHARVASSPIVSTVWAHSADPGPWPHAPDRARRLLSSLGWEDRDGDGVRERDGQRFAFELLTNADNQTRTDAMVLVQEDLRRIGVEARLRRVEMTTMAGKLHAGDFDAVLLGFTMDTSLDLTYGFHSEAIDGGFNFGGYANPEVDRLIEAARASRDTGEQGRLLRQIQGLLHHDQPFAFLWEPDRLYGVSRRLRGVQANPLDTYHRIDEWWLAPESR